MTTGPLFRQEIELLQQYSKHKSFTFTTTSSSAEDAVTLAMSEANKISFVVELADAYIEFDDEIWIGTKISIKRASSTNARIRGIIWGR